MDILPIQEGSPEPTEPVRMDGKADMKKRKEDKKVKWKRGTEEPPSLQQSHGDFTSNANQIAKCEHEEHQSHTPQ